MMMVMRARVGLLLVAGVMSWGVVSAQTYYKWMDANGTVHYGEAPPPAKNVTTLRVNAGNSVIVSAKSLPASATSSDGAGTGALGMAEVQYRQQACAAARKDVTVAESNVMLVSAKDATTAHRLTSDERIQAQKDAQIRVSQYCAPEKSP